ncbi:hypothetical protein IFM61606_00490 [Aspergillus udagawae]|nr:hypothetical protein IFM61606_00490 [Aspergillus udagawae]
MGTRQQGSYIKHTGDPLLQRRELSAALDHVVQALGEQAAPAASAIPAAPAPAPVVAPVAPAPAPPPSPSPERFVTPPPQPMSPTAAPGSFAVRSVLSWLGF